MRNPMDYRLWSILSERDKIQESKTVPSSRYKETEGKEKVKFKISNIELGRWKQCAELVVGSSSVILAAEVDVAYIRNQKYA